MKKFDGTEEKQIQVFIVSTMVFRIENDIAGKLTRIYHCPGLILAQTIEEAAENAKSFCFEKWKIADGYHGHQAAICPIFGEVVENRNLVDMAGGQIFEFDTALDDEILT